MRTLAAAALVLYAAQAGCARDLAGPAPRVTSVSPSLACNAAPAPGTPIVITGDGFAPVAEDTLAGETVLRLPEVALVPRGGLDGMPAPGDPIVVADVTWQSQRQMTFRLPSSPPVPAGIYDLGVTNPDGRSATLASAVAILPPPEIDAVAPNPICDAQFDVELQVQGRYLLFGAGGPPTVTIAGMAYPGYGEAGCLPIGGPAQGAQLCSSFKVLVAQNDLAPGSYAVTVANPAPADCVASAPVELEVVPPPTVTDIDPQLLCTTTTSFLVRGAGFRPGAQVTIDDGSVPVTTTFVDDMTLEVQLTGGTLAAGLHDVTVTNPEGCSATAARVFTVAQDALLFFVDPPVLWNGIATQVTIYGSSIVPPVTAVELRPAGSPAPGLSLAFVGDPASPNRIQAVVPEGTPEGVYDVLVTDGSGCTAILAAGLQIVADVTVVLTAIDPPFGWTGADTAVSVRSAGGFQPTPRLYLSPVAGGSATATAPRAVAYVSADVVTAIVPPGLMPGGYDVIAVNPDGSVGVLLGGFTVTADAPPVITDVSPASVDAGTATAMTILGSGFSGPTVTFLCRDSLGTTLAPVTATVTGSPSATSISITAPTTIPAGSVCLVRVTNAAGTWGEFSAVAFTNPASNLEPFKASSALTTPRRALAVVAGRPTSASRFLYAIGGDGGTPASSMATVESATVDPFGELGSWTPQRRSMTRTRTLMGAARIGSFIYVLGGQDDTLIVNSVERARILDPLDVPEVTGIDLAPGDGAGIGGGTWVYRVSGVRDAAYASDPGGETLPSEPVTVTVPELPAKIQVTLEWDPMPNVVGYRIYRTPTAGLAAGQEELLAELTGVMTTSFTDTGGATTAPGPLPLGSLGVWHEVANMTTARRGHAVVAAEAPGVPGTWYLYAAGGRNAVGNTLASYEYFTITIAPDGSQTISAPTPGATTIGAARWYLPGYVADHRVAPAVPSGTTFVYFAGGRSGAGSAVTDTWVGRINTTPPAGPSDPPLGMLVDTMTLGAATPTARCGGAGAVIANGFLFLFGGGGAPSIGGHSAEICAAAGAACTSGPPTLKNWNSLGAGGILTARFLMGTAVESAFIYVIGGATDAAPATASTERTLW